MGELTLAPGTRIHGYVLGEVLGRGGMGTVYAATHEFLGARVALKVLHAALKDKGELVAKMRAEAQLLREVDCPYLVRVTDAGVAADGTVFMAMDLLRGESLRALLDRERVLEPKRALRYAFHLASGLVIAHLHGVVHRDLKPENAFITEKDEAKVLDFGTARFRTKAATLSQGQYYASVAYASPEQLSGEALDARSDVYCFGIMLHEMLVGRHYLRLPDGSFPRTDELVMMPFTVEPNLDGVPAAIAAVVRRAVAKRPGDRFPTMEACALALRALLAEAGGDVGREGATAAAAPGVVTHGPVTATTPGDRPRGMALSTTALLAIGVAALASAATVAVRTAGQTAAAPLPAAVVADAPDDVRPAVASDSPRPAGAAAHAEGASGSAPPASASATAAPSEIESGAAAANAAGPGTHPQRRVIAPAGTRNPNLF